jgi:DNA-binding NarL/FixJ family response regulator
VRTLNLQVFSIGGRRSGGTPKPGRVRRDGSPTDPDSARRRRASFLHSLDALLTGEPGLEIVGKAASGEEALAAAARAEPDVAVIDVLMPTMSGIECAQLLQKRYPKVRVILISGSIFEDKRPHPDERGTDAYLEKSKVPERLHATILALAAETPVAPLGRTNA